MITAADRAFYNANGYALLKGLFSADEVAFYLEHYMKLRAAGSYPGDMVGVETASNDPLLRFPRMIHMHHWDDESLKWLIDSRLREALTTFLGAEPLAVQTMLVFKPPGARGQALHQDNFYIRVRPGTCMASWLALEKCDEENGCMQVVPGSHEWPVLCPVEADTSQSFTDVTVPLPDGVEPVPVYMEPGDVLFFNGSIVHGSFPNRSKDRFRRALIGHYVEGNTELLSQYAQPVLRMDGSAVELVTTPDGGPCGVWVEDKGRAEIAMVAEGLEGPAGRE